MTTVRALLDSTIGRRLLVRIWLHGVLLFAGVVAIVLTFHYLLGRQDAAMAARAHPEFTLGLAERALAVRDDPAALAHELHALHDAASIDLTVFAPDGTPIAATGVPQAPARHDELTALAATSYVRTTDARGDRFVVGAYRDHVLTAYAVALTPAMPSTPLHVLGLCVAALVLAFVFVAAPLTRSIARPLEELRSLSRELGDGNLSVRAPTERRDEIGDLARSFNRMAEQIQQLRASERELLADVSHELRTPLARMRVVLDLADDPDHERSRAYLREITTDLSELEQVLDNIIMSSRLDPQRWDQAQPPIRRGPLDIDELVETSVVRFRDRSPDRQLACTDHEPHLVVDGDPVMLRRALDNLVDNARKYSPDDAAITVTVERSELRGKPAVRLAVADQGVGIVPEDQPRVFTAFFRADRSRTRSTGGVGLGLALARRIVEAHDGTIGFTSERDRGSLFWFVVPLAVHTKLGMAGHKRTHSGDEGVM